MPTIKLSPGNFCGHLIHYNTRNYGNPDREGEKRKPARYIKSYNKNS
jgi:hypothetical protein